MADKSLTSWGKWQQTRNVLALSLALNIEARNSTASGSTDEKRLNDNIDRLLADMQEHALNGLKKVDLAIAADGLVKRISDSSNEAKNEADRLNRATATLHELTKLVGQLGKLVALFSLL